MSWTLLFALVLLLGLALLAAISRRVELGRMARSLQDRELAVRQGSDETQLQHPVIDLSRCLGCAVCVDVCPEDGVLELVHGQAVVVNGARCMGYALCEKECPVGAITVTIANLEKRSDVPAISDEFEAVGSPGLFLAGEVTAHTLILSAVAHGTAVAAEAARRVRETPSPEGVLDLCIVGAGPAGLACSLEATRNGLRFVTLEQESLLGGTVAKYPRRKLVISEPVDLPLHGRLEVGSYTKEELMAVWQEIADEHQLPIEHGEVFRGLTRDGGGNFVVRTEANTWAARFVCLALGRRGVPRKLGIPGEDLPKVASSLLDARSYADRRILVVGGGDSAVEAALGLAEQSGNEVTISYRRESFFRIRAKNEERLRACIGEGRLTVVFSSQLLAIHEDSVDLAVEGGEGAGVLSLPNDDVFVLTGGTPPLELLQSAGVSFDPSLRKASTPVVEQGTGLVSALGAGFALALSALAWALWHSDYYVLPMALRPAHDKHAILRPGLGVGLWLGIAAVALVCANLLYLVRRAPRFRLRVGSLQAWMTSHVATGILAFLCAMMHGGMTPRDTPGGHAFWALAVLLVTGAIGRYFYAFVPRAANGRELELAEAKARLARVSAGWDQTQRAFGEQARREVGTLIAARQWKGSFAGRVMALLGMNGDLRRTTARLAQEAARQGIAAEQVRDTLALARAAHRTALMVAQYEDLRAVLNTWRWIHRWVAALMVLLVVLHIVHALAYGTSFEARPG